MPRRPHDSEAVIQDRIRNALRLAGFTVVDKTHGNMYQPGWPDLYAFHPHRGPKWIEVKTPTGELTVAQRARFSCWHVAGVQIHVLCDADLTPIYQPGNWFEWLKPAHKAHFEARRCVLAPGGVYVMTHWEDWL